MVDGNGHVPKMPPHNDEAEVAVLGSMLLDADAAGRVASVLRPAHFFRGPHSEVYQVLTELYDANRAIDVVLLREELQRRGLLEKVGGTGFLSRILASVPTAANAEHYARIVMETGLRREVIRAAQDIATAGYDDARPATELVSFAATRLALANEGASPEVSPEWETLHPSFYERSVPSFPIHVLPRIFREHVRAAAAATGTPPDLAGTMLLGISATAAALRYDVEVRRGWREPANLYLLAQASSGAGKTPAANAMLGPLDEWEDREREAVRIDVLVQQDRHDVAAGRLEAVKARAQKAADASERREAVAEAETLRRELEAMGPRPELPRLRLDDSTPEALAKVMSEQGGRVAVLSDEASLFDAIGRYSAKGAPLNLDVYLRGYDGSRPYGSERVGRGSLTIKRPTLTLCLFGQPRHLVGLVARQPDLSNRGMLQRFLFAVPAKAEADPEDREIPEAIRYGYAQALARLLSLRAADANGSADEPRVLRLSSDAHEMLKAFRAECLGIVGSDPGELMGEWLNKHTGRTARLALNLHLLDAAAADGIPERDVPPSVMARAVELSRYFLLHTMAAFEVMGADPAVQDAAKILRWIERHKRLSFSKKEAFDGSAFERASDLDEPLRVLVERGFIRPETHPKGAQARRGRKSERYEVNPATFEPAAPEQPVIEGVSADFAEPFPEDRAADQSPSECQDGCWSCGATEVVPGAGACELHVDLDERVRS